MNAMLPIVTFGSAVVYPRARELRVSGQSVEINTCAFEILLMLIEADGRIVSKKDLFQRLWPRTCVAETNLRVHMYKLRRALGENAEAIRTEPNRGYRLTARVVPSDERPRATNIVVITGEGSDIGQAMDAALQSMKWKVGSFALLP